jgi:hypothetical protein
VGELFHERGFAGGARIYEIPGQAGNDGRRFSAKPGMTADESWKGREVLFFNFFQNFWETVNLSSGFLFAGHFI